MLSNFEKHFVEPNLFFKGKIIQSHKNELDEICAAAYMAGAPAFLQKGGMDL